MKRWMIMAAVLLISGVVATRAQDKITIEATNDDISEGLDLKAVATLFGEVKDLTEFEKELNSPDAHLNNLDINGDGTVDYLRVVEVEEEKDRHLVIIQAILAKDIFQDVASIYVEHKGDKSVTVQVIGDEYIYGKNYIIEPVYIYRPIIYDWFWGPSWVCYSSPWYWGYWPGWYAPYPCWGCRDYWVHVHVYHYNHPCCSYRYARTPHEQAAHMRQRASRTDYARANASHTFASRTGMSSARELQHNAARSSGAASTMTMNGRSFGSRNTSATRTTYSNGTSSSSSRFVTTTSNSRGSSYTSSSRSGSSSRMSSSGVNTNSSVSRGSSYNSGYSSSYSSGGYNSVSSRGGSSYSTGSSRGGSSFSSGGSRGGSSFSSGGSRTGGSASSSSRR